MADAPIEKQMTAFHSHEEAKEEQRRMHLAMTPLERVTLVEKLRAEQYPYDSRPDVQRTIEINEF